MKRILSMWWVLAALACSSVKDKQECSVSTDCPVGQYCAHAGGEARCWADSVSPVVGTVTASCTPSPCLRDGVLHVEADITDDAEVLDAAVALDFAPGSPVALAPSGGKWAADVQLRGLPFPAYSRNDVVATVTARDGARNASNEARATGIGITRLRWERLIEPGGAVVTPGAPAVKPDGTVVIGGSDGRLYFVAPDKTDAHAPLAVGAGTISAAPAIGADTIWVGSEDGNLYGVAADGSAVKSGVGVNTGGAIKGSVAVLPGVGKEWAFVASNAGYLGVASTVANENDRIGPIAAFSTGPVIGVNERPYAATASGSLRAFRLTVSPVVTLADLWASPVNVGGAVTAPIGLDANGYVWTGTVDGKLTKMVPGDTSGTLTLVTSISGWIVGSPVVLANGDVVVGEISGSLHRISPSGTEIWTTIPNLETTVESPLVLSSGDAMLLVPAGGKIFVLHGDGSQVWSGTLDSGTLRAPNLYTPPGQTAPVMSTAYLTSSSGKLFAVIVDGQLDAAAPWPKAFHDPRNTNRAGPQP